ncbi:TIGR00725 family protein [Thermoflexus sp.]|uniref:TIGR00725 family protein n=1 Tax=Thermoflexus sp. TaxID=1969742 RepID=UPI0025E71099|nr:TIGR00725 family protein [Thermoflexus sp.]MCS6962901.1 TIGR00725 family protein [Thermoflexus sp.]MCX7690132.1 TIGR00725 family protein [Thermoflexus sp.]MDW8183921.1 TIGR00725 family protein [Anaerolineae bacterium]
MKWSASSVEPPILIAVVGSGEATPQEEAWAYEVGRRLAMAGAVVVCGGRSGVMEAVCRGAVEAGGLTVGILPGSDHREANPYVRIPLPTGLGEARNALIVRAAHAVIAIGGEFGTLSEIALALKWGIPVIGLGTWSLHRPGMTVPIETVSTPEEAASRALARARGRQIEE